MVAPNPFTPRSGLEPKNFVGREAEKKYFEKALNELLTLGRQNHFLVLGSWGIGKTSLLREFKKIAQEKGVLSSFISLRKFRNSEDMREGIESLF